MFDNFEAISNDPRSLGRKDLLRAGPAVRDESGRIIGCKGLAL